jgi:PAS domain S-box-containing protein
VQDTPALNGRQAEAFDRLGRLQALTASLSQAVTSEQVADAIIAQGMAVLGANAGCVTVLSDDRSELLLLRIAGAVEDVARKWGRFPLAAPVPLAEAVREGKVVVLETFVERSVRYPALEGVLSPDRDGAMVALPMVARGDVLGSLGWGWPADRHFTDEDRAFLLTLAGLCGQALDRARLFDAEREARERAERAENHLRESEGRLRAIIDNWPSVIFVKDPQGRYLLANRACEAYAGEPVERIVGKTDYDYLPAEVADRFRADDLRVLETGQTIRYEEAVPLQGESRTSLTAKFPLRDTSGQPYAVCGIATDITDLKRTTGALRESEERFARFMQHLPGLAWVKDEQGRYVYANDAAARAFGKPPAELYGRTDEEVFPPATAAQFRENDREALASGTGVRAVETLEHQDGVLHHSLVSKFPIPATQGATALVGGMAIDITEEMRTRAVLKESEERFRATFEQAAVGIAMVGPDGRWLRVNHKLCDILGYLPDEMTGLRFQDITHPDDLEADLASVQRLLAGGIATYSMEKRYVRKDRSLVWANLTVSLVRTPQGQPKYFISVVEDITARKAAEEALRESEQRLRAIGDNLPLGAVYQVVGDPEGRRRFLYISAGVERLLGLTSAEVLADASSLYGLVHEEDHVRVAAQEQVAGRDLTPFDCEFRSRTRTGDVRWLHCRSAPRRLPTGETVWEGIVMDVTDRKRAAEALDRERELLGTIVEKIPVMLTVYEPGTRVLRLNPAFERATGWTTHEAAGASLMEQCYPDPAYRQRVEEFMQSCVDGWMDIRMRTRDGRDLETSWANVRLSSGTQVGIGIDITDRKQYEQSLKEADRRKDEFLATLAHELRNPLAPIRNGLQVMKVAAGDAEAVEPARAMMERQLGQLVHLIDDLLDVSRITRGKLALRWERIDLASVVQNAIEGSRPLIEASAHRLAVTLPPVPVWLDADPTRLAQVFANLLTNAAKYTERGGHIWLTAGRHGGEVIVSVKDTGIGIAADHLPRVFEMFSQAETALERSQGGLGIGLSLVRGLVEMHGGTVEARSEGLRRGSEFVVRLPVRNEAHGQETREPVGGEKGTSRPRRRILVADDNRDAADSLALLLRLAGHEVHAVHDGQEALEAVGWFRPDVALLDIGMPKLNGYEVARRIRGHAAGQQMVLVAITGWGQEEDKRRAAEAGFDHHLTKPVDPAALERLLSGLRKA